MSILNLQKVLRTFARGELEDHVQNPLKYLKLFKETPENFKGYIGK